MGTLFHQLPRKESLKYAGDGIARRATSIADDFQITIDQALKCIELDIQLNDYDVKDEQLSGFGMLLEELISILEMRGDNENISN